MDISQFLYFPDVDAQEIGQTGAALLCTDLDKQQCVGTPVS